MSARLFAALTGAATLVFWFFREAATHWFFEKVVRVANDNAEMSFEYGVPAAFAAATFYLLMRGFGPAGTGNPFERTIAPTETPIVQSAGPLIVNAPIVEPPIAPLPAPTPLIVPPPVTTPIPTPKIEAPEKPPKDDAHVTPEVLVGLYEGQTDLGAEMRVSKYIGKWMPVSGPLLETMGGWPLFNERAPVVASFASQEGPSVIMVFHGEWIDRLATIPKNGSMFVYGQIKEVGRSKIVLDPCELIDSDPKTNTPKRPRRRRSSANPRNP
jgi:hypothetical protein